MVPVVALAKENKTAEDLRVVGETIKYYKTVSVLNTSAVTSITSPEVSSFTTEITEEEYNNVDLNELYNLNLYRTVETNYKILKTTISENGSYYQYRVDLTWKNIPKVRSNDIIAIGHYASVTPLDSWTFKESICYGGGGCMDSASGTRVMGKYGSGVVFHLPTDSITYLTQTYYFSVKKTDSSTTVLNQLAAGDYAHAVSTVSETNALKFRVDLNGIIHDPGIEEAYYDSIGAAIVEWHGTW